MRSGLSLLRKSCEPTEKMKKIVLLFVGAAVSFLLLSYIDAYETFIVFFSPSEKHLVEHPDHADLKLIIHRFNDFLAKAYLSADPSLVSKDIIDEKLIPHIAEEIFYLAREGKVMDLKIKDIEIKNVEALSPDLMRVSTREVVGVSYLSLSEGKEVISYPDAPFDMIYTLTRMNGNWKVTSYETRGLG